MLWVTRTVKYSLVAFALFGCGGDDDDSPGGSGGGDTTNFVGTWQYTSGTATTNCMGMMDSGQVTGNITVTKGSTSDLLVTDGDCATKFDVSGTTATAPPGQSCSIQQDGASGTQTVSSLVFTTGDGKTGHVSGTFNAVITVFGQAITCTVSVTADLQKL